MHHGTQIAQGRDGLTWSGALQVSPVLASVGPWAARLAELPAFPTVAALDAAMRDRLALEPAVSLEPQVKVKKRGAPRDRDTLYEVRIHVHRRIPTRERSWHDLLNVLVWAAFPHTKRALVARQHAILEAIVPPGTTRLPGARTREQDALALLDEGGIVLMVPARDEAEVRRAHHEGDEDALRRLRDAGCLAPLVFGHALMEHVLEGGGLDARGCGVVLVVDGIPASLEARVEACDAALARWVASSDELLAPSPWRGISLAIL